MQNHILLVNHLDHGTFSIADRSYCCQRVDLTRTESRPWPMTWISQILAEILARHLESDAVPLCSKNTKLLWWGKLGIFRWQSEDLQISTARPQMGCSVTGASWSSSCQVLPGNEAGEMVSRKRSPIATWRCVSWGLWRISSVEMDQMDPTVFQKKHTDNRWKSGTVNKSDTYQCIELEPHCFCQDHFCDPVAQDKIWIRHPRLCRWPRLDFEIRSSSTARNIADIGRVLAGEPRNHITVIRIKSLRIQSRTWTILKFKAKEWVGCMTAKGWWRFQVWLDYQKTHP